MISRLLQPDVQKFILEHEHDDEKKLVLQKREILGVPSSAIAEQIASRRKAKAKLPLYYNTPNILFPPGLNLEQSSSEKTASFKADVLRSITQSNTIADLTGGLGIDSFFFSKVFKKVINVEINGSLHGIARHNHKILNALNIDHQQTTAEQFLKTHPEKFNCVFIDPSRRTSSNQKVFKLSGCVPNVPDLLSEVFQKTDCLLIKTSPLLDIQQGIKELSHVEKVWVVSVDNECKELLFFCRVGFVKEAAIVAVNLTDQTEEFSFTFSQEKKAVSKFSEPLAYLYEPNASLLKAGAFKLVGNMFSLNKLHSSTQLYTSENLITDFPGRIFKIIQHVKPDLKVLKEFFPESKANVITRNYPLSPEELKKKTKLKDGGELYLIGFSGESKKYLVAAQRIK